MRILLTAIWCLSVLPAGAADDGDILEKLRIPDDSLQSAFLLQTGLRFVDTTGGLRWKPEMEHLSEVEFYSITYLSDGLKVKGFLAVPAAAGSYPSVIYNRGGNRDFGMITPIRFAYLAGKLSSDGYVIAASNYRGVDGGEGMEEFGGADVHDVLNLLPVLEQVDRADTARIGMYGWSRGSMMSFITLTLTDRIKALVVGGILADIPAMIADRPAMDSLVLAELVPDYYVNKEEEMRRRSAIAWVDQFPADVPILMLQGTSDWRTKPDEPLQLAMKFNEYRIPYRLIMYEGADHGISEFADEVDTAVLDWFDRYLKYRTALPDMEYHGR